MKRIAIVAGEASGDELAAGLILALKKKYPDLIIEGIAGPKMIAAGCNPLFDMQEINLMGLFEIIPHIPRVLNIRKKFFHYFQKSLPDLFIGIDSPDFNLSLEKKFKTFGIPTVHYSGPTVWAWRQSRMKLIREAVDLMLVLFPFEKKFYDEHQLACTYVGHPLAKKLQTYPNQETARQDLGLPQDKKIVAILPGSRAVEIKNLAKDFIQAARLCLKKNPDLIFIAPMINAAKQKLWIKKIVEIDPSIPIQTTLEDSRLVMQSADVVLLASGTATLEALLLEKPMVVAYKLSWLTYLLGKCLVKLKFFALPNLLASKKIVPEFLQKQVTPEALSEALLTEQHNVQQEYSLIKKQLLLDTNQLAAEAVIRMMNDRNGHR